MKRAHAGILATALGTVSVIGLAASPASAASWTVTPANTAISATASSNIVMSSGSSKITCTGGSGSGTTGDGTNAAALATVSSFSGSGCKDNILGGSWTMKLTGGNLGGTSYNSSTGTTTGTISGGTVTASGSDLGLTCSFTATGTLNGTYTNSTDTIAITGGTATLSNVSGSGCGLGGISNGSTGTVTGSIKVSPGVTITSP